jgi:hypothetical protein
MAKDAKGHGSGTRSGKQSVGQAIRNDNSPGGKLVRQAFQNAAAHGPEDASVGKSLHDLSVQQLGEVLGQGHPKSGAAPVHDGASGRKG